MTDLFDIEPALAPDEVEPLDPFPFDEPSIPGRDRSRASPGSASPRTPVDAAPDPSSRPNRRSSRGWPAGSLRAR